MTFDVDADRAAIRELVQTFFAAFTSGPGVTERLAGLRDLFLPEATIVRILGGDLTAYTVDNFIAPRESLLVGGTLTGFREWEESGRTEVFGSIAHRFCAYAKTGVQDGVSFTGRGVKSIGFVRTFAGWRISAVSYEDEPQPETLVEG